MKDNTVLPTNAPAPDPGQGSEPAAGEGAVDSAVDSALDGNPASPRNSPAQEPMPWDTDEQPPAPEIDLLPPQALPVIAEVLAFLADIGAAAQEADDEPN